MPVECRSGEEDCVVYLPLIYLAAELAAGNWGLISRALGNTRLPLLILPVLFLAAIAFSRPAQERLSAGSLGRFAHKVSARAFAIILALTVAAALVLFFIKVSGGPIFQVDYSAFQYREHLLKQTFPRVTNYDPFFNAGQIDHTIVGTGSISLFILTFPFLLFLPVETAHKLQPALIIALTPLVFYFSMLMLKRSRSEALIAAFISLTASSGGYLSYSAFLSYGLLPYLLSSLAAVVAFAACFRIFISGDYSKRNAIVLVIVGTLGMFHLTFPVVVLPLLAMPLLRIKESRLSGKLIAYAVSIAALLAAVNLWWILDFSAIFDLSRAFQSKFSALLDLLAPGLSAEAKLKQVLSPLGARLRIDLVVLIFGIYGTARLLRSAPNRSDDRRLGGLLAVSLLYLAFITFFGSLFLAGAQNGRFLIPLAFMLVIPAAVGIRRLFELVFLPAHNAMPRLSLCNRLIAICYAAAVPFHIFSLATSVSAAPPHTIALLEWIKANTTEEARIYCEDFGEPSRGFSITKNGQPFRGNFSAAFGGSFAFAQALTGRSFVTEPYNSEGKRALNPNRLTDFKSERELRRYFELYNVKHVIVFSDQLAAFLDRTGGCRRAAEVGGFIIYQTDIVPDYFLEGRGRVVQRLNRLEVAVEPAAEIVLKYRFVDGLKIEPPLELGRFRTFTNEEFIRVKTGGTRSFVIEYRG